MKILVFKLNQLGDNVSMVPAVQALVARRPDWSVTLMTSPLAAELYQGPLGPHTIVVCPTATFNDSYRKPWQLAGSVLAARRLGPDACLIAFDQGNAAHLVARMSGAPVRIGANPGHVRVKRSLTEDVWMPADERPATWNWAMARALARALGDTSPWPDSPPPPDLRHLIAANRPASGRGRVVIHPGASGPLNRWPVERFAAVARALSGDREVVWMRHGPGADRAPEGCTEATVESLRDACGWMAGADLFLGNNSGPMHLANALGCPGVVVTGSSALGWDPFWNRGAWTVLRHPNLACAPCETITKRPAACANTAKPLACLDYWTAEKVEAACRERLKGVPPP